MNAKKMAPTTEVVLEHFADRETKDANLQRKRVYILPSMEGLWLGLCLFIMLFGSINYNSNLGFILTFLLGGIAMWATVLTWRNLCGINIRCHRPKSVFAGEELRFLLQLHNHTCHASNALLFTAEDQGAQQTPPLKSCWCSIEPQQSALVHIPHITQKRGLCRMPSVRVATVYPLGWFRAWSALQFDVEGLVYPRPAGNPQLPAKAILEGQEIMGQQEGVDDFTGLRRYHPGDSPKLIFWKTVAQEQELMVKMFTGSGSSTLILSWEHVSHLAGTEARLSQLCLWVLEAAQCNLNYGLHIPGTKLPPSKGDAHRLKCLNALAMHRGD
ncbi:MAG: DUF58 domain-containing protein [Candidatus Eutrophobiaceae bacterium]